MQLSGELAARLDSITGLTLKLASRFSSTAWLYVVRVLINTCAQRCQNSDCCFLLCCGVVVGPIDSGTEVGNSEGPYPDRLTVHRKGKPGQQEEAPLACELRCWPNMPQVCLPGFIQGLLMLL